MATKIGTHLRARAKNLGLSDAEVARRLNLSQTRYSNYVNGIREPDFQTLVRIAHILETSTDFLLGVNNDPEELDLSERNRLTRRIQSAISTLPKSTLRIIAPAIDAIVSENHKKSSDDKK